MEEHNTYNQEKTEDEIPTTLSDRLIKLREVWTKEVADLNNEMKSPATMDNLINVIYSKRQDAVNLYFGTMSALNKQLRIYKSNYAGLYNQLKQGSNGIRYTNEASLQIQCEAQLTEQKEVIDELKNFTEFVWETVKSIDGMHYGILNKLKIYDIVNGIKM
jgi:hypothetical protein